jgi:glycosyltransferase involved in cell wall biosynthesis
MAMGTPVVSTAAGVEGLGAIDNVPARVANTPSEFARHVVCLLRGEQWQELSTKARNFIETRFTWESSLSIFENLLSDPATSRK